MALTTVLSVSVRPDRLTAYEDRVRKLAERAVAEREAFRWTAHQVLFGEMGTIHFVSESPDWKALGARERVDIMVQRLMGEREGAKLLDELNECTLTVQQTVSIDRVDLSYPPERVERTLPLALITTLRVRPGGQEACEELIRKVAEAIPKVDDPGRLITHQVIIGDLSEYFTVRPLRELAELERQLQPADLLNKAFGVPEGSLIFRNALESLEHARRQVVIYRPDLSNPS